MLDWNRCVKYEDFQNCNMLFRNDKENRKWSGKWLTLSLRTEEEKFKTQALEKSKILNKNANELQMRKIQKDSENALCSFKEREQKEEKINSWAPENWTIITTNVNETKR